jgi:hypothetical protein
LLARAGEDAAAALAAPDPDLAHERAEVAAAQAAEARGEYGRPQPEADNRAALAGSSAPLARFGHPAAVGRLARLLQPVR